VGFLGESVVDDYRSCADDEDVTGVKISMGWSDAGLNLLLGEFNQWSREV